LMLWAKADQDLPEIREAADAHSPAE
jgi:hypothetical protein